MSLFHSKKSRQLCARGMAEGADVVGIDSVFSGVGPNPAHGTLYVVQLYWPEILAGVHQPVIDRECNKAGTRKIRAHPMHGCFVEADPASAMDQHHGRTQA